MNETWLEVPNTNGRYSVSNFGNVRSNWSDIPQKNLTHRIRIESSKQLKPVVHTTGYLRVALGRGNYKYIHRLVALVFLSNPESLPQVDHIDGNRQNNHVENLRWVSVKDNARFGGERHNWKEQKIASAKRRMHEHRKEEFAKLVAQGCSLRSIARAFGVSHSTVSATLARQD